MGWQGDLHREMPGEASTPDGVLLGPVCSCCPAMWGRWAPSSLEVATQVVSGGPSAEAG